MFDKLQGFQSAVIAAIIIIIIIIIIIPLSSLLIEALSKKI